MHVRYNADFNKHFDNRLTNRQKIKVLEMIEVFIDNPFHEDFRNHELYGKWKGFRSISIEADLRLHYRQVDSNEVLFVAAGNHQQLYK